MFIQQMFNNHCCPKHFGIKVLPCQNMDLGQINPIFRFNLPLYFKQRSHISASPITVVNVMFMVCSNALLTWEVLPWNASVDIRVSSVAGKFLSWTSMLNNSRILRFLSTIYLNRTRLQTGPKWSR